MPPVRAVTLPPPPALADDVACFCIVEHTGSAALSIDVAPQAVAGMVFQHHGGRSALQSIATPAGVTPAAPTLFVYGPGVEPSTMHWGPGPYTSVQVVFKPHALATLFGLNAGALGSGFVEPGDLGAAPAADRLTSRLADRLLDAPDVQAQLGVLADFLTAHAREGRAGDDLVAASLRLIHGDIGSASVRRLTERLHISQRQFERRFRRTVGVPPQSYIRVQRVQAALRLIRSGRCATLTEVAHTLGFYDQAHLSRDIKQLSGLSPKQVSRKQAEF